MQHKEPIADMLVSEFFPTTVVVVVVLDIVVAVVNLQHQHSSSP
jgi:hypothetical protein